MKLTGPRGSGTPEDFEEVYRTARFLYILYINEIMRTGVFPNL